MILILTDSDKNFIGQTKEIQDLEPEDFRVPTSLIQISSLVAFVDLRLQVTKIFKNRASEHRGLFKAKDLATFMDLNI